MTVLASVGVVVALGMCGVGAYAVVSAHDDKRVAVGPTASPAQSRRDIHSRQVDPAPLTVRDVFPTRRLVVDPQRSPYVLTAAAQSVTGCRAVAAAALSKLLQDLGCNQVVRATMRSPDREYLITAGVINLKDDVAAQQANDEIRPLISNADGRFYGYVDGPGTRVLNRASTYLSWQPAAHFLTYCVIARADGKDFATSDPRLETIIQDILVKYLVGQVLADWAMVPGAAGAGSSAPVTGPTGSG